MGQPQPADGESSAAPEPYSYGYETDSHSAAEQRDPNGKVSGFYTIVDADGRQRRVDYIADEAGFRAKVQTNEVGTKSENSADVEMLASPPTEAQLAPVVAAAPQQQVQVQRVQTQVTAAPARSQLVSYQYQPGYTTGGYYGYGSSNYGAAAYPAGYGYGYGASYPAGYGYGYTNAPLASGYGYTTGSVGNYNNHLPSQYYRSVQYGSVAGVPAATYGVYGTGVGASGVTNSRVSGVRYVTASVPVPAGGYQNQGTYRSSYSSQSTGPVATSSQSLGGSSNYIVLKKREAEDNKKNKN